MNRDERRDCAPARPPRRWRGADGGFTAPVDGDAGGTWIAAKDSGVVLALLNHQAADDSGVVGAAGRPAGSAAAFWSRRWPRKRRRPMRPASAPRGSASYAPFRLFVAGAAGPAARVHVERPATLSTRPGSIRASGFLTSSSRNPRAVIPARHARFRAFARARTPG